MRQCDNVLLGFHCEPLQVYMYMLETGHQYSRCLIKLPVGLYLVLEDIPTQHDEHDANLDAGADH